MFNIGPAELIVILLVALLIVGPKRLPEVGKSVGKALREIRRQTDEVRSSFEMTIDPGDEDDDVEPIEDVTGRPATEADDAEPHATDWGGEDAATTPPEVEADAGPRRRRDASKTAVDEPGSGTSDAS